MTKLAPGLNVVFTTILRDDHHEYVEQEKNAPIRNLFGTKSATNKRNVYDFPSIEEKFGNDQVSRLEINF